MSQYHYNVLDILLSVEDNDNKIAEYTCYPDDSIKSIQNGSLYTEYAYDGDKNLTGLKTMLGKEVLVDNHYSYDHNGNRTERQQPGGTTRYTYDSVNQLTQIEYPTYTEQLYYDKAGNRSRRITDGTQEEYRYDPANHLTEYTRGGEAKTFTYDKAGNLTADDRARYTYDLFNRTEKVETFDGHIQINHYDAEGLRSGIEEDGRLVQFIFRSQEVVTQLEEEKGMTRYIRGYDLIASDADCARTYYHYASDELGSITHVVAGEDILNRYEYDAWGNLTLCEETVENRFKFNGQQYDPISQQYYLRARYYNPVIGRFTQEDTYRGDGLNLYAYCRNNPVYYADPSGHSCDNKDTNQKQSGGSESFADQLTQHVADDIAFNQEHGLTTYYDTPQAEAANSRVAQDSQTDTSSNRPRNPEAGGPDNSSRQSGESDTDSVIYRRVQGGSGNNASQMRIEVNADGTISIPNKDANLCVSIDGGEHSQYFANKRGGDVQIVEVEVPRWFDDFLKENAIPQTNYKTNPLNQGGTAPKITDTTTPGNCYELPAPWVGWLEEYGGNARIVDP